MKLLVFLPLFMCFNGGPSDAQLFGLDFPKPPGYVKGASEIADEQNQILLWESIVQHSPDIQYVRQKFLENKNIKAEQFDQSIRELVSRPENAPLLFSQLGVKHSSSNSAGDRTRFTMTERLMLGTIVRNTFDKMRKFYEQYHQCVSDIVAAQDGMDRLSSAPGSSSDRAAPAKLSTQQEGAAVSRKGLVELAGEDAVSKLDEHLKNSELPPH